MVGTIERLGRGRYAGLNPTMVFHSYQFVLFMASVWAFYWCVPQRARRYVLLVASYLFYGAWSGRYALLILASTTIDYGAALGIRQALNQRRRRLLLATSLLANLGILGTFKYYGFFASSLETLLPISLPFLDLLLPVGISFYTFQSMSYTVDVYRGRLEPTRSFVDFALYVSFFPQLVAGPIVRAGTFLPQLDAERRLTQNRVRFGLKLFVIGLFKKLVIADNLALWVDRVHLEPLAYPTLDLWATAYAFAFQIYFDFSAYSEMAIGLAALLGFTLPVNFRQPYCARNIADFWHRWHITLSTWLRDYLYIPLGGSRVGRLATARNLMITMVLGGLWHGAAWTMLAWGALHGAYLVLHRWVRWTTERWPSWGRAVGHPWATPILVLLTFHCWTLSMVLFRSASIDVAWVLWRRMFGLAGGGAAQGGGVLLACGVLYAAHVVQERLDLVEAFDRWPLVARTAFLVVAAWGMVLFAAAESKPFLYFQF